MGYEQTTPAKERISPKENLVGFMEQCVDNFPYVTNKANWGVNFIGGSLIGIVSSPDWKTERFNLNILKDRILRKAKMKDQVYKGIDCEAQTKRSFFGMMGELSVYDVLDQMKQKGKIVLGFSTEKQRFDPKEEFEKSGVDFIFFPEEGTTLFGVSVKSYYGDVLNPKIEVFDITGGDQEALNSRMVELKASGEMKQEVNISDKTEKFGEKVMTKYEGKDVVMLVVLVNRNTIDEVRGVFKGGGEYADRLENTLGKVMLKYEHGYRPN
jgi:hypothetical protein